MAEKKKNRAAVELGRLGGRKRVPKGFSMLSPEQRKANAQSRARQMAEDGQSPMTRTEAILAARKMRATGEFSREVVGRVIDDVDYDRAQLSCGHSAYVYSGYDSPKTMNCGPCAREWVDRHTDHP